MKHTSSSTWQSVPRSETLNPKLRSYLMILVQSAHNALSENALLMILAVINAHKACSQNVLLTMLFPGTQRSECLIAECTACNVLSQSALQATPSRRMNCSQCTMTECTAHNALSLYTLLTMPSRRLRCSQSSLSDRTAGHALLQNVLHAITSYTLKRRERCTWSPSFYGHKNLYAHASFLCRSNPASASNKECDLEFRSG